MINLKTMEIRANARKNEENWGKYITKYILVISFQYAFQSFPSESIRPARLLSGGRGGCSPVPSVIFWSGKLIFGG